MSVDQGYADSLKGASLQMVASDAQAGLWPDGRQLTVTTPFASRAAAASEGARQAAFHGGPKVIEKAIVVGLRRDLIGRVIAATGNRLGYSAAPINVAVLGAAEQPDGTTVLTVVRRL